MHVYRLYTYSSARPTCLSPYPGDDPPSPPAPSVNPVIIKSRTIEQSVFRPTKAPNFGEKRERERERISRGRVYASLDRWQNAFLFTLPTRAREMKFSVD